MRTVVNKPKSKTCEICEGSFSLYSFASHIRLAHNITSDEYATKYGEFRKIKPASTRTIKKVTCAICNKEYSSVGMFSHLRDTHQITKDEYVTKFGEYNAKKEKLNVVSTGESGNLICLIDGKRFETPKQLYGYVHRIHQLSANEYVLKYIFNGIQPTCKCGCGTTVPILTHIPYRIDYVSGHNKSTLGFHFSSDSKKQMRQKAVDRLNKDRELGIVSPRHTRKVIFLRVYKNIETYKETLRNRNIDIISDEIDMFDDKKEMLFLCLETRKTFSQRSFDVVSPFLEKTRSKEQDGVSSFIRSIYSGSVIENTQKVLPNGKEIDIYLPDVKIGIEYNGNYYHSESVGKKDSKYHIGKTLEANGIGIHLVQIFSDEWLYKKDIVKEKIRRLLVPTKSKIFARKCLVKEIGVGDKNPFLEKYHIQGEDKSETKLGLFFTDELVAVMTFSQPNVSKGGGEGFVELSRFATKFDYQVIGAAGKLFSYYIKKYSPARIITYADRRWTRSTGNLYTQIGFVKIDETTPNYFYLGRGLRRLHRFQFTKSTLVSSGGDPTKTEWELMQELGYDRIWDCGHLKYEWTTQVKSG